MSKSPPAGPRLLNVSSAYALDMLNIPRLKKIVGMTPRTRQNEKLDGTVKCQLGICSALAQYILLPRDGGGGGDVGGGGIGDCIGSAYARLVQSISTY